MACALQSLINRPQSTSPLVMEGTRKDWLPSKTLLHFQILSFAKITCSYFPHVLTKQCVGSARKKKSQHVAAAAELLGLQGGELRARHPGHQEPDARVLHVAPQPGRERGGRRLHVVHQPVLGADGRFGRRFPVRTRAAAGYSLRFLTTNKHCPDYTN